MKTFPMFLQMAGRRVTVVGGGEQAAQKVRLLLKTEAQIIVHADDLDPELEGLRDEGKITQASAVVTQADFTDRALVFIATGCPGADAASHAVAKAAGAVVNVVDQPDLCDAITPSIVDRDPVVVAIGTEGTAPVLARQIKTKIEQQLEPRLGDLAALAGRLRDLAANRLGPRDRRDLWRWVFNGPVRNAHARGAERDAAKQIKTAIETGEFSREQGGSVALVGAGPGAKDLITLRGVQRLQEADIIFYDRLVDPDILELARRDAERVYVGKAPGNHSWPQDKISNILVSAAKQGKRVVRLKCGDPGIFARGLEEAEALEAAGIAFEIVPGVTAATAACAAQNRFLTERQEIDAVIMTTGRTATNDGPPEWLSELRPGTRVCLYMGVHSAVELQEHLLKSQYVDQIQIEVVAEAQTDRQKTVDCGVRDLMTALAENEITGTAILSVVLRKSAAAAANPPLRLIDTAS
ncbi:uroporphyrin-III C-methyltransferase / precorrin-2 dehydrogenase / sirohydrochlorin ferrochelatase [Thalassococcus halodurans]|uniref:Uroporphyrin-III C-methyltransferase / precorrin-2 dehydrogenase / sirohydrochlorin ferrochelatase n=1 Tax=Thalassococcus halodurans TaxID=373675 RepID=A0A1H5TXR7_9RHOB|nr:siroheme synthase CysG [Thalassococcus halodurans]SEF67573.1 uroporphyrin-III C-methyltransferase / precorrin-2 dehydrogenase / sirohydrochlorin ferrochelatase [Thalassococcus halodurans]